MKLNKYKTEIIALGGKVKWHNEISSKIKKGPFKALGVWFSDNYNDCYELNLKAKLCEIQRILKTWSKFSISLKGKIMIIKTLIMDRIINIRSIFYVPQHFIKKNHQMHFLWGQNKRPKVKKDAVMNDAENNGTTFGGLRMVNFENAIISL